MAQYIEQVGYGLSEALPVLAPKPKKANRVPTTSDKGFLPGQIWIYTATNAIYMLSSVVNNLANWQLLSTSGAAGSFAALSSTGATTLATTGASTSTFGNTTGASSVTVSAGSAGITLNAPFVALPGPVYIYSGAGVPSNALALHIGDIYVNTTAASAVTRMYIATAVGTWTNITCAA